MGMQGAYGRRVGARSEEDQVASAITALSDTYVEQYARLDPIGATFAGINGFDDRLTDFSPDAALERADHARSTLRALDGLEPANDRDRVAAGVMREILETQALLHEHGEDLRAISVLGSPIQEVREAFDVLQTETEADWEVVAARMAALPDCLSTLQEAYTAGIERGLVAARRQVVGAIEQVEVWAGTDVERTRPYFLGLADRLPPAGGPPPPRPPPPPPRPPPPRAAPPRPPPPRPPPP